MSKLDDLYEKALQACKKPSTVAVRVGEKTVKLIPENVTIYQSSDTFAVYSPKEARAWAVTEVKDTTGESRVLTIFIPKGKKGVETFVSPLRKDLLILKGWGHPETLYDGYKSAFQKVQDAVQSGAKVIFKQENAPG